MAIELKENLESALSQQTGGGNGIEEPEEPQLELAIPADKLPETYKVYSWNLWTIPFGAPRALSNPRRCGEYAEKIAKHHKWDDFDGLIIFNFQELWAYRTGIFPPCLLILVGFLEYIPCAGQYLTWLFQAIAILLGILPILKCLPIYYNPKTQIIKKLRRFLPYHHSHHSFPIKCFIDNGLLMLFNEPFDESGFVPYQHHKCDDSMAYKGFLWVYFAKRSLLVMNTHLQAAGDGTERQEQLNELGEFIRNFRAEKQCRNVVCAGDFNIDQRSNARRFIRWEVMQQIGFQLGTDYDGSDGELTMNELRAVVIESDNQIHSPSSVKREAVEEHNNSHSQHSPNEKNEQQSTKELSPEESANYELMSRSIDRFVPATLAPENTKMFSDKSKVNIKHYETYVHLERMHPERELIWKNANEAGVKSLFDLKGIPYPDNLHFLPSPDSTTPFNETKMDEDVRDRDEMVVGDMVVGTSASVSMSPPRKKKKEKDSMKTTLSSSAAMHSHNDRELNISPYEAIKFQAGHPIQETIGRGVLRKNYLPICDTLNCKKINTYEPTMKRYDWNIDHILVHNDMTVQNIKNGIFGKRSGLSDHFLLLTQFEVIEYQ